MAVGDTGKALVIWITSIVIGVFSLDTAHSNVIEILTAMCNHRLEFGYDLQCLYDTRMYYPCCST